MEDQVILVDENDTEIGVEGKMIAHRSGSLHRAISIFIFDSADRLLLQKRAASKYHSAGLWSNTCCSHPRPREDCARAARRRLREEMGIDCELDVKFDFVYRAVLTNHLVENEFDHVFFGRHDGDPMPNPDEAEDWKWVDLAWLRADLNERPYAYSFWLEACLDRVTACRSEDRTRVGA